MLPITIPDAIVLSGVIVAISILAGAWIVARRTPAAPTSFMAPFAALPPLTSENIPTQPSGIPVTEDTELEPGMAVLALWENSWWNAKVVSLEAHRRVKIHYADWDASWDEIVPRSRLQISLRESLEDNGAS